MRWWLAALLLSGLSGLPGCRPEPAPLGELAFLRGAVLAPSGAGGRPVGGGRELVERPWTPGEELTLGRVRDQAPQKAECVPLFSTPLGDVSAMIAMGAEAPNTALAWAPDGETLAVGTHRGEVLLLDGWTGAVRARRSLSETMVKSLVWSGDGETLYAAEQSPDAYVHALDHALQSRWRFRLADELESSPAPPATDIYGVYTLPAAWSVLVLRDGDLLVAGTHSWRPGETRFNRARLWRLRPDGSVRAAWPKDGPADATLLFPHVDEDADLLAISVARSADGPAPSGIAIGGVQVLTLSTFTPRAALMTEPLAPHFTLAKPWEAIDVRGEHVFAGFSDGRARIFPLTSEDPSRDALSIELGTPFLAGEVPLAAPVSWGFLRGDTVLAATGGTNIPWGSQTTVTRPPSPHPRANRLTAHGLAGELRWAWSGEYALQGLSMSPDETHAVLGGGKRASDGRRDLFGALIFRLDGEGGGEERLEAVCPTDGPVFFRQALRDDGRVAVAEFPWKGDDGAVLGAYRVTVLR